MGNMDIPDMFRLDDGDPRGVPSYISPLIRFTAETMDDEKTVHVTFRAPASLIRRIDEIIASRADPRLKTRSDFLVDSVAYGLYRWDHDGYPDGLNGTLQIAFECITDEIRDQSWIDLVAKFESKLEVVRRTGDISRLKNLLRMLEKLNSEPQGFEGLHTAPVECRATITRIEEEVRRLYRDSQDRVVE